MCTCNRKLRIYMQTTDIRRRSPLGFRERDRPQPPLLPALGLGISFPHYGRPLFYSCVHYRYHPSRPSTNPELKPSIDKTFIGVQPGTNGPKLARNFLRVKTKGGGMMGLVISATEMVLEAVSLMDGSVGGIG